MSSWLGHRLFGRLSHHSTDWRHIGTVERDDPSQGLVHVALCNGGSAYLASIDLRVEDAPGQAARVSVDLIHIHPLLKMEPTDNFCLDAPMGPSVGTYHDRPTQVIDSP